MFFYNEPDIVTQDPYFYSTSLLLNMDSDFSDSSAYQNSVTTSGNATVSTTESKFGGGSGYFDGSSGTGLSFSSADQFDLRGVDWTIEAWVNPNGNYNDWRMIVGKKSIDGNTIDYQFYLNKNDQDGIGIIKFYSKTTGLFVKATTAPISNQWNHVAAVRYNGVVTLYLNGQPVGNGTGDVGYSANNPLTIGSPSSLNSFLFTGHIDDVRITKGVARYTSNFTPPTQAHPTTGPSEIVSTDLQLHLDAGDINSYPGTGTVWYDLSGNGYNGTLSGTSFSSDVGGNIVFNGSAGVSHGIINLTNSFTYWSWVKVSARADMHTLLANATGGDYNGFKFTVNNWQNNNRNLGLELNNGSGDWNTAVTDSGLIQADVWYNVAFSFENTTGDVKLYVNGNLKDSYSNFVSNINTNQNLLVGKMSNGYELQGNKAVYMIYSKILKDAEVLQNFHATKDRFGL